MSDTLTASKLPSADTGTRSLLLLIPEAPEARQHHVRFLSELQRAGLLGIYAGSAQSSEVAEAEGRASVVSADGMTEQQLLACGLISTGEALVVLSLRPLEMTANDWDTERSALLKIQELLPLDAQKQSRAYTLSLPFGDWANPQALYADWDAHYVLNTTNQPSVNHPRHSLQDAHTGSCYGQQLLTALSIAGAWKGAPPPAEVSDHHDAGRLPARFVSSSIRLVFTPSTAPQSGTRHIPTSPPWPLPDGGGCEAANPGTVPGIETANQTAELLGFRCVEPPASRTKPPHRFRLWRNLPYPEKRNSTEEAASEFLRRITENVDIPSVDKARAEVRAAMSRLGLQQVVVELTRSGFTSVADASKPTPETWTNLYRVCIALVDGSTLPESIKRPETEAGDRLVWADPEAIITPPVVRNPQQESISVNGDRSEIGDDLDTIDHGLYAFVGSNEKTESEDEEDQLNEIQSGLIPTGVEHDRLISRLSAILDLSVRQAVEGFCAHAYVEDTERDRYKEARVAQLKARKVLQVAAVALIVAFGFVLDHRFGWVASIWESAPLRLYRPTTTPTASIVGVMIVLVIASIPLLRSYQTFMSSAYRLTLANYQRAENSRKLKHYVSELQRLALQRRQYVDHLKAIQRLLHRPLGDPQTEDIEQAPEIDWFSLDELPPGLLILSAAPSDLLDTEERKRLSKVFSVGWLDAIHTAARRDWEKSFKSKIVAGFEWPEQDVGESQVAKYRNRVTGEDVMGARTDWAEFVTSPTGLENSGKAWLQTELARADRDLNSDYAAMLTDLRSVTNHAACWKTASECLAAAVQTPDFDWGHLLSTGAGIPQLAPTHPHTCMIPLHDKGLLALLAWELVSAEPVHYDNLPSNEPLFSTTDTDYIEDDDV